MDHYSVQVGEKRTVQFLLSGGYLFVKLDQPSCDHHHASKLQHLEEELQLPRSRDDGYVSAATLLVLQNVCDSSHIRNAVLSQIGKWYTTNWDPPTEQFGHVVTGLLSVFQGQAFHLPKSTDRPRILEGKLRATEIAPSGEELLFWLEGCEEPGRARLKRFMLSTYRISVDAGVHPQIAHLMGLSEPCSSELERYTTGLSNPGINIGDAVYPPLSPSLRAGADPQYLRFYETSLQGTPTRPLPGEDPFVFSESETVQTATVEKILTTCRIKIYFPSAGGPVSKEPTGMFFHGGGWQNGDVHSDSSICSQWSRDHDSIVICVNCGRSPQDQFPKQCEGALEAFDWIVGAEGQAMGCDPSNLVIAGVSSGGHLVTTLMYQIISHRRQARPRALALVVPILDNRTDAPWRRCCESEPSLGFSPFKMARYQADFFARDEDRETALASPVLVEPGVLQEFPDTFIAVAGMDFLRHEGLAFGHRLKDAGVRLTMRIYEGQPHNFLRLDRITDASKLVRRELFDFIRSRIHCS